MSSLPPDELAARIAAFSQWHYQFELDGQLTPIVLPEHVNRQWERKRYFFDPVIDWLGGSLEGKRVLDLGCNAGFWSLAALDAGADFVLGVDGRRMHIDQANLVFEVKQIDGQRYEFVEGNVFDLPFADWGPFDLVLCLGLLYHVAKPFELFERIAQVNTDVLLVDTAIAQLPGSFLSLGQEAPLDGDPRRAVDYRLVTYPTKRAVRDIAGTFGYSTVVLKPDPQSDEGMRNYKLGTARAFVCSKRTPLSELNAAIEPLSLRGRIVDSGRLVRNKTLELLRPHSTGRST